MHNFTKSISCWLLSLVFLFTSVFLITDGVMDVCVCVLINLMSEWVCVCVWYVCVLDCCCVKVGRGISDPLLSWYFSAMMICEPLSKPCAITRRSRIWPVSWQVRGFNKFSCLVWIFTWFTKNFKYGLVAVYELWNQNERLSGFIYWNLYCGTIEFQYFWVSGKP